VEARIREINPTARIHRATRGDVPIDELLGLSAFSLERVLDREPDFLTDDSHEHGDEVRSVSFEVSRPIDPERFNAWISQVLAEQGQNLLRTKGILDHPGEDRRFAFQAVHMIADGGFVGPWPKGQPRKSRIVFIGRDINRPKLRRGFEACQVSERAE
jgi:G3E family GTPase